MRTTAHIFGFLLLSVPCFSQTKHSVEQLAKVALEITLLIDPLFTEEGDQVLSSDEWNEKINEWIWLMENPIKQDQITRERLSEIPFLNKQDIELILNYSSVTPIKDWEQFIHIDGFNPEYPDYLAYFFDFTKSHETNYIKGSKKIFHPIQVELFQRFRLTHAVETTQLLYYPTSQQALIAPGIRTQLTTKSEKWQFSALADKKEGISFHDSGIITISSWNLYRRSEANRYLILGNFRVKTGSGILLSQSSGSSSTGRKLRTTSYSAKPSISTTSTSILNGLALGLPLGKLVNIDAFFAPNRFKSFRSEASRLSSPNLGLQIQSEGSRSGLQLAFTHQVSGRWAASAGVETLISFKKNQSTAPTLHLSGEVMLATSILSDVEQTRHPYFDEIEDPRSEESIKDNSSILRKSPLLQFQSFWSWSPNLQFHYGMRHKSAGFEWKSGSFRSSFDSNIDELEYWFQLRGAQDRERWPQRSRWSITKIYMSTRSTSPELPATLRKEKTAVLLELKDPLSQTLTLQTTWARDEELDVAQGVPGDEQWSIYLLNQLRSSALLEHLFQTGLYHRIRVQHVASQPISTYMHWEHGIILDQSLHVPIKQFLLKWKVSVYRTGASTSGRVVEEHLYKTFSSFYVGGVGNVQSLQLLYESSLPRRNVKPWNSLSIWIQLSRHERLRIHSNNSTLIPEPVQYRLTLQTRIRF